MVTRLCEMTQQYQHTKKVKTIQKYTKYNTVVDSWMNPNGNCFFLQPFKLLECNFNNFNAIIYAHEQQSLQLLSNCNNCQAQNNNND